MGSFGKKKPKVPGGMSLREKKDAERLKYLSINKADLEQMVIDKEKELEDMKVENDTKIKEMSE